MHWDTIESDWKQFASKVKQQWNKLTDEHLHAIAGKRVELQSKIEQAYGVSKEEAEKQIQQFEAHQEQAADAVRDSKLPPKTR